MSDVGNGKHLRSHQQVLSLISFFLGRPVCPPFYQPGVVLEVASHRAVEGILVSPAQHKPYFFLFFFPKQQSICCQLLPTFLVPLLDAETGPRARHVENMTHTATG